MECFLQDFVNGTSWSAAAIKIGKLVARQNGKGTYISQKVQEWSKAFILDHKELPVTKHSTSAKSAIQDKDLQEELLIHLQAIEKYVTAQAIVDYLAKPDVQQQYNLSKTISLATA